MNLNATGRFSVSRAGLALLVPMPFLLMGIQQCEVTDADGDDWTVEEGDCNDEDASINPAAPELCDGIDSNCTGVIDDAECYLDLSGGLYFTLGLDADGRVWASGTNVLGQLGDGTGVDQATPVSVSSLSDVTAVSAGSTHGLAIKGDGSIWSWGDNTYGQLGDGTLTTSLSPVMVLTSTTGIAVAGGEYHSLALAADGTVWAWGYNGFGQLGDGTTIDSPLPLQISGLTDVVAVSAGIVHSLALKADGTVWAWGNNDFGQLGSSDVNYSATPVQVGELVGITAIDAGGGHNLALATTGLVWSWGANGSGQLGSGNTSRSRSLPLFVAGISGAVAVSAGNFHSLVLLNDGTSWGWGDNYYGQMGDGTSGGDTLIPVQSLSLNDLGLISAGGYHTIVQRTGGEVWGYGHNLYGALGDGTFVDASSPVLSLF